MLQTDLFQRTDIVKDTSVKKLVCWFVISDDEPTYYNSKMNLLFCVIIGFLKIFVDDILSSYE